MCGSGLCTPYQALDSRRWYSYPLRFVSATPVVPARGP
jgi:hypothetical protein